MLLFLVVAAIINTITNWTSQMIVTLPLAILYEISVIISSRVYNISRRRIRRNGVNLI